MYSNFQMVGMRMMMMLMMRGEKGQANQGLHVDLYAGQSPRAYLNRNKSTRGLFNERRIILRYLKLVQPSERDVTRATA